MNFKGIFLITILLSSFLAISLDSVAAQDLTVSKIVHIGDEITYNKYKSSNVKVNGEIIWRWDQQSSCTWHAFTGEQLLSDLANARLVRYGVFVKEGYFKKTYKWTSGFFNNYQQLTTFEFTITDN